MASITKVLHCSIPRNAHPLTIQSPPWPSMSSQQQLWTAPAKEEAPPPPPPPPPEFLCPITLDLMQDPVAAPTGITYDRAAIETWLFSGGQRTCPVTHGDLSAGDLVPNHTLRRLIQDWYATNRCCSSVDRVPATPEEAAVAELEAATRAGDAERCAAAARGVRRLAWRAAEQNRRRGLESAGAARALAAAFTFFAATADDAAAATDDVLDVVLAALVLVMPMDEAAILAVGSSSASVARLVAVAANGDLHRRLQAVVVIREIISLSAYSRGTTTNLSANTEAIAEVLVKTIRDGICSPATRACLVAAYHLACTGGESAAAGLSKAGIVTVLVELLVDADRSTAEKALAALDAALAASGDGRARARADALAMPVLVKKMFCVSDAATALVVSVLLRICKKCPGDGEECPGDCASASARNARETAMAARRHAIVEALQLGALQKVLLLLQVGCSGETKENAAELLRLMVRYQGREECCVDAMDLRGIKRDTTAILTG
ncbi:hypothetical protein BDA96_01G292000 [Sorghum bicolor]|uniref:U-box domain-containing protein n=1 Tax=Sorghum bicolor TaxID=4558 RepID=A0A921S1T4_SORBI|nr:hypothetical protein BDA96_01G292000 [Sorghum bicolor]